MIVKGGKLALVTAGVIAAALLVVVCFNFFSFHQPAAAALSEDPRNEPVDWAVYARLGVVPGTLVLDLRNIDEDAAMLDVDRGLFMIAERFAEREFDRVILAYKGQERFQLPGAYFQRIGEEYSWQNPVVLIRELPQNVYFTDGSRVFNVWTGGVLGVMSSQLADHQTLHELWYLEEYADEISASGRR